MFRVSEQRFARARFFFFRVLSVVDGLVSANHIEYGKMIDKARRVANPKLSKAPEAPEAPEKTP